MDSEFNDINAQMEREYQEAEKARIVKAGVNRLAAVGLALNDLEQQKMVIDMGADEGYIARAVKLSGVGSRVVSVDIKPMPEVTALGLEAYQFDATKTREWPDALNGKADLVISKQGPLFVIENEVMARRVLEGALKSLTAKGRVRVFPARFGFIKKEFFGDSAEYHALQAKNLKALLADPKNNNYNLKMNELTKEWLTNNQYKFEVGKTAVSGEQEANLEYLILRS